jgi:hypothetical protein
LKMTKEEFQQFWAANYPETLPINYLFKHHLKSSWLRIHSLPESKRYAENEEEWLILLERQNTVFNDLIAENSKIYLVTGVYGFDDKVVSPDFLTEIACLGNLNFAPLESINLHEYSNEWSDEGTFYTPYFAEDIYISHRFDELLKRIADDNLRVFFIGKDCLIAPYDGGVDIIFKDTATRDFYKSKYKNWLSNRADGM